MLICTIRVMRKTAERPTLTKAEAEALRILTGAKHWTITMADEFLKLVIRLEKKGYIRFVRRPNNNGSDTEII